ncbi:MAG: dihydroxyacetone kinase subunit DhaK [Inquilinaceae bacterium]
MSKKLINDPKNIITEMLEGIVGAHPGHLRQLDHSPRSVIAVDGPREGKVGILIGGGSGHEPAFIGYVGRGLADAAAIGNVFASPSPDPILEATKEIHGGAGVVYLYGNYAGDVMNFDMAAEMAAMDDIEVRTVLVTDDVASAPPAEREKRRGVAGGFFVFKAAGAAADAMLPLDRVVAAAEKANGATLTMGVALAPCSLPHTRKPNFELGDDEMEIGLGIHGEPGVEKGKLRSADAVTDDLLDRILAELGAGKGDRVALLVNGLGATPLMELYLMHRRAARRLIDAGIAVHKSFVGEYVTSLEMAGASLTLMRLDDELTGLLDRPCDCAMFRVG